MFSTYDELQVISQSLRIILEEHQKSHELFQKMSQQMIGMLYQFQQSADGNYSFPYTSLGINEVFELEPEDVYLDIVKLTDRVHFEDLPKIMAGIQRSAEKMELWQAEYRIILPKKGIRYHFGQSMPELQADGSIIWYGCVTDITDSKNIEKFYSLQKIDTIGRLTSGIAHDFNNILSAIVGYNQLNRFAVDDCQDVQMKKEILFNTEQVEKASERATELIKKMMAYTFQNPTNKNIEVKQTYDVIEEVLEMMRPALTSLFQFKTDLDHAPTIQIDSTSLHQILTNLIVNARDAMKQGGQILISLKQVTTHALHCSSCIKTLEGEFIELNVADDGTGIDKTIVTHIFDPFFTTKPVGEGTGLGLSTVSGMVHEANGHIIIESITEAPNTGTTFRLLFPIS
jgi:nitrogen-specific signal transduction histidine kinase